MLDAPIKTSTYPVSDVDPFSREYLVDPYPFHEQLRQAGPVVWLSKWSCWGTGRHKGSRITSMKSLRQSQ